MVGAFLEAIPGSIAGGDWWSRSWLWTMEVCSPNLTPSTAALRPSARRAGMMQGTLQEKTMVVLTDYNTNILFLQIFKKHITTCPYYYSFVFIISMVNPSLAIWALQSGLSLSLQWNVLSRDFPGGPVVKPFPSDATCNAGWNPGQEAETLYASWQKKKQKTKHKTETIL